ncbi:LytTR family transcriptional regulator [Flavobacterium akiainvivens]|uniref:LytTR family transcriptional regulator n=1 Tax=Flavobacterium akiainvivens TaxID=1202724 RepID=A0A0M8MHG1_9FLAO|nr:LytTR family DNA-binding domain-containing protein [Flavobacterium akiainvivens]KOS05678.1 LytTR family transcriptional regulator [Flavobacterium akiainvivens]SFQ36531.1 two component transcriptional regulator, LytTR family [Flavobacterium akiainvivens]
MTGQGNIPCIIVDDEPAAHYVLANYIKQSPQLELVFQGYNGVEAMQYLENHSPQLMFLDIDMPEITGIDMLKKLKNPPRTILTTAYSEFALESYEYGVIDYLLKPIYYPRFVKSITRFMELAAPKQAEIAEEKVPEVIYVKVDSDTYPIEVKSILYAQSYGNYVKIFTQKRHYLATITTNDLEKLLPSSLFMRAHKSYIIALDKVDEVYKDSVVIRRNEIPIGITYRRELGEKLQSLRK